MNPEKMPDGFQGSRPASSTREPPPLACARDPAPTRGDACVASTDLWALRHVKLDAHGDAHVCTKLRITD